MCTGECYETKRDLYHSQFGLGSLLQVWGCTHSTPRPPTGKHRAPPAAWRLHHAHSTPLPLQRRLAA